MIQEIINQNSDLILVLNIVLSAFLTGLIWLIQLVHYPLFLEVSEKTFGTYEKKHQRAISPLVAPVMLVDIALSFILLFTSWYDRFDVLIIIAFAMNALVFLSTLFIFAPLHQSLSRQYSKTKIRKLIRLNFFRTFGWTALTIILAIILYQIISL